jgi:hypothetical protein
MQVSFKSGAKSPHSKALHAKLSVASALSVVCLRSGSTIQRFDDLTAAKQFVFIRVYSWLTFADDCG